MAGKRARSFRRISTLSDLHSDSSLESDSPSPPPPPPPPPPHIPLPSSVAREESELVAAASTAAVIAAAAAAAAKEKMASLALARVSASACNRSCGSEEGGDGLPPAAAGGGFLREGPALMEQAQKWKKEPSASIGFLHSCFNCKRRLTHGRDIYIYRGDTAFCSEECRQSRIRMDEQREREREREMAVIAPSPIAVVNK